MPVIVIVIVTLTGVFEKHFRSDSIKKRGGNPDYSQFVHALWLFLCVTISQLNQFYKLSLNPKKKYNLANIGDLSLI